MARAASSVDAYGAGAVHVVGEAEIAAYRTPGAEGAVLAGRAAVGLVALDVLPIGTAGQAPGAGAQHRPRREPALVPDELRLLHEARAGGVEPGVAALGREVEVVAL